MGPVRGLGGNAVLVDNRTGSRTFLNIGKAGVGMGVGVTDFTELVILHDRETLENLQTGQWLVDPATWSAVGDRHSVLLPSGETMSRYTLTQSGAAVSTSVGLLRISVNKDLTDTGISEWGDTLRRTERTGSTRERTPYLALQTADPGPAGGRPGHRSANSLRNRTRLCGRRAGHCHRRSVRRVSTAATNSLFPLSPLPTPRQIPSLYNSSWTPGFCLS